MKKAAGKCNLQQCWVGSNISDWTWLVFVWAAINNKQVSTPLPYDKHHVQYRVSRFGSVIETSETIHT